MNKKKLLSIVLSVVLLIGVVGGTWAYLTTLATPKQNNFTFGDINTELLEPNWPTEDLDEDGVPDAAQDLIPGDNVPKDPQIKNTGAIDEYVAIRISFRKGTTGTTTLTQSEMTQLLSIIRIQSGSSPFTNGFNTTDWALVSGYSATEPVQVWYYKAGTGATQGILAPGATTSALFNNIYVNAGAGNEDIALLRSWGGFHIYVEGAAIQADNYTFAEAIGNTAAANELVDLFP